MNHSTLSVAILVTLACLLGLAGLVHWVVELVVY